MEIRRLRADDVDAILAIFDRVADELIYIGTQPGYDRKRKRQQHLASVGDDDHPTFVALDGETVAGSLSVHDGDRGLHVGMLLDAPFRRRGFGRALIEATHAWARERGIRELFLTVFPHNEAARALYRACGYVEVARFERAITRNTGDVWDFILMRAPIA